MRGSADVAGLPEVRSRRAFLRFEIVCPDQPPELKLESTPDFSHSEMRAARGPFFGMRFGHIFSLAFLTSSSVAAFREPQFRQQKCSVFCNFAAGTRNHRARSTSFSCNFSNYPPEFFLPRVNGA